VTLTKRQYALASGLASGKEFAEKLLWHGDNSMARTSRTTGEPGAGCSKSPSSKAATSEEAKAYASVR
jgi:hypothetical protein